MVYTDLLFVFVFLPVTVILSLLDRSAEYKNLILIISSLIFYAWGRPVIVLLLFLTVFADYIFGLGAKAENKFIKNAALFLDAVMNCSVFVVFARNGLFREGGAFERYEFLSFADKLIPLGIAFYTVRGISYVFDVYKGNTEAEKNPFCLLTYMASLHFMMAGPIVRYEDVRGELRKRHIGAEEINGGLTRFVFGLGKAVVLAPVFKSLMAAGLDFESPTTLGAWFGMLGFLGYVYWSFAGYTDMALGLGLANGFHYKENVLPFKVGNGVTGIADGFNRTLHGFFRESIVCEKNKLLYVLTSLLCGGVIGLWYGFTKGAVGGALYFAVFIIMEKLFLSRLFEKLPRFVTGIYTVAISLFGASVFYFDSLWKLKNWAFFCIGKKTVSFWDSDIIEILKGNYVLIAIGILAALPFVTDFVKKLGKKISEKGGYGFVRIIQTVCTAVVLLAYTTESYMLVK